MKTDMADNSEIMDNNSSSSSKNKMSDVTIRLLRPEDEKAALKLIWRGIFYHTGMDVIADKVTSLPVVSVSLIVAALGFIKYSSVIAALVWFLFVPCFVYVVGRFVLLPLEYHHNIDLVGGFYDFWRRNEIGRTMWVAEIDGAVVATLGIRTIAPQTTQIYRVVVHKRYRGRGVARALLEHALMTCKSRGQDHVVLKSSYVQTAAHALYRKHGFSVVNYQEEGLPAWTCLSYGLYLFHYSPHGPESPTGIWAEADGMNQMGF